MAVQLTEYGYVFNQGDAFYNIGCRWCVALHSSAFRELTGKANSFILSLDLEPVLTAQKQHEATDVLSLLNYSKRDRYF